MAFLVLALAAILSAGCGKAVPVCPPVTGTPIFLAVAPENLPTPTPVSGIFPVKIEKREIMVNKIVEGPLCNDEWNGSVYVGCNVQVYPWIEDDIPKDCHLTIEPDSYLCGLS
jgi:hypothetical protein